MFDTQYILKYLYTNNYLLYQKNREGNYYYRLNPYKKEKISEIDNQEIQNYLKQFNFNYREVIYCLCQNLQEEPKCPYCNKPRKYSNSCFAATCCSKECHQKEIEKVNLKKYGVKNVSLIPSTIQKIKETNMKKYGTKAAASSPIIKERTKKRFQEKYGKDITCSEYVPGSREKRNQTWKLNRDQNVFKIKQSFYKKYGVYNPSQVEEFQNKKKSKYKYENKIFDSSLELIFYLYCKDNGYNIIRSPKRFSYRDFNKKLHYYYPDFQINDRIIEIKGSFLLDKNKKLTHCQLDEYTCTEQELEEKDKLAMCKQRCMDENNVLLLTENDLEIPKKFIHNKYGINYLNQFKN